MTDFETKKQAAIDTVLLNTTAVVESGGPAILAALRALTVIDATTTQSELDAVSIREILGVPSSALVSYTVETDSEDELIVQYKNQLTSEIRTAHLPAFPSFPDVRHMELDRYIVGNSPIWVDPVPHTREALVAAFDPYIAGAVPSINEQSLNYKITTVIESIKHSTPTTDAVLTSLVADYLNRLNTPI